jgi:predicted membrane protein (TIGR00267 family)
VKLFRLLFRHERQLAIVMGLAEGILTALLLAAGRLLGRGEHVDLGLAVRVAIGGLATTGFIFYVGRYAELRRQLVHAELQLNLASRGHLATTHLGRAVFRDAVADAMISGTGSFAGSLLPLILAVIIPSMPFISIAIPVLILGLMGFTLGRVVAGSSVRWTASLMLGGLIITAVGFELHLV